MKINWSYHIHTNYTHGQNSVYEIAAYCKKLNIKELAITEHIRLHCTYKFDALREDILKAAKKYGIKIFIGVEAKILPEGLLDVPRNLFPKVDLVIGSVHSWPADISLENAYKLLVKSPATIIGHPQIVNEEIIKLLIEHKKVMEISYKYPLSSSQLRLIQKFPKLRLSLGADAHQLSDIKDARSYFTKLIREYHFLNQLWKIGEKI
jgi:histidinol phosphatase-like PHP family hydrolase